MSSAFGLVAAAFVVQAGSAAGALTVFAIWLLVLIASSSACYLIAGYVHAGDEDDAG